MQLLEQDRIPEKARRWYVVRAQAFVQAMRPKRLGELTAEEIKAFFPRYAREQRLTDWQYRQTVEALHLLPVRLGGCRAADRVEWDFLAEAGQALSADHPTRVGTVTPAEAIDNNPRFSGATDGRPLLKQMAQVLRAKRYALRTEQTYVDWCHRFLRFLEAHADHAPGDCSTMAKAEVQGFLTREWIWQYVFASARLSSDPKAGVVRRHHLHEAGFQKVRTVQELLGHKDMTTTMIYTHVMNRPGVAPVRSPADVL